MLGEVRLTPAKSGFKVANTCLALADGQENLQTYRLGYGLEQKGKIIKI